MVYRKSKLWMFQWSRYYWDKADACWYIGQPDWHSGPYNGAKPVPMRPPNFSEWAMDATLFLTSFPPPQRRRIIWDSMHESRHWDVWETISQGAPKVEVNLNIKDKDNGTT